MNKTEIIQALDDKYDALIQWLEKQPRDQFEVAVEGKWSPGQHVDHLIKSSQPLNQALRLPKMALSTMFGKNNREERSYDEVTNKYKQKIAEGGQASGKYLPKHISSQQKSELVTKLRSEGDKLAEIIQKWDTKRLSIHLLPHPLLGKMTINEMMYFTIMHVDYHHQLLIRDYGE